ncbi:MAG: flagellar biosynthetic protein FliO [Candidatus Margulisiibacteriota bacterium]
MTSGYYLQLIITLLIFLGVLLIATQTLKRYKGRRFSEEMKIIDRLPIDAQASLVIVDVRGKTLLMSVGTKHVELVKEL